MAGWLGLGVSSGGLPHFSRLYVSCRQFSPVAASPVPACTLTHMHTCSLTHPTHTHVSTHTMVDSVLVVQHIHTHTHSHALTHHTASSSGVGPQGGRPQKGRGEPRGNSSSQAAEAGSRQQEDQLVLPGSCKEEVKHHYTASSSSSSSAASFTPEGLAASPPRHANATTSAEGPFHATHPVQNNSCNETAAGYLAPHAWTVWACGCVWAAALCGLSISVPLHINLASVCLLCTKLLLVCTVRRSATESLLEGRTKLPCLTDPAHVYLTPVTSK